MRTLFVGIGLLCCALQAQGLAVDGFPASFSSDNIIASCAFTEACGDCCDIGADCGEGSGDKCLGWLKQSDHRLDDFISPMTNPVFFEDSRTLTEARMIFLNHALTASLGGQNVQVCAMQLRAALIFARIVCLEIIPDGCGCKVPGQRFLTAQGLGHAAAG